MIKYLIITTSVKHDLLCRVLENCISRLIFAPQSINRFPSGSRPRCAGWDAVPARGRLPRSIFLIFFSRVHLSAAFRRESQIQRNGVACPRLSSVILPSRRSGACGRRRKTSRRSLARSRSRRSSRS
jgi:hypothetical protein